MAALKDVRKRIKAVQGIEQVTKAMKMVATVKMKRIEGRLLGARPYSNGLYALAGRLAAIGDPDEPMHPLLAGGGSGSPDLIVVLGADRGLCGSFNMALVRYVVAQVLEVKSDLVLVGRKTAGYFARRSLTVVKTFEKMGFPVSWDEAEAMGQDLVTIFSGGGYARIRLVYQRFASAGTSRPIATSWLPFSSGSGAQAPGDSTPGVQNPEVQAPREDPGSLAEFRCEPSVNAVLGAVLPRALTGQLYLALLESQASEQGARMVAMDSASTNANELVADLTLLANRLRQTGITKELLEITTGAEALNN